MSVSKSEDKIGRYITLKITQYLTFDKAYFTLILLFTIFNSLNAAQQKATI